MTHRQDREMILEGAKIEVWILAKLLLNPAQDIILCLDLEHPVLFMHDLLLCSTGDPHVRLNQVSATCLVSHNFVEEGLVLGKTSDVLLHSYSLLFS